MFFNYAYKGHSSVDNSRSGETAMSFAPDLKRAPTFFVGELAKALEFREAISALHDVVVSDLRFKPKDKTAYKAWAAQQLHLDLGEIAAKKRETAERIRSVGAELHALAEKKQQRLAPFYKAQRAYFDYLYEKDRDTWFVLDPVITVHPDEIFFECFSQDESSYGRLGVGYDVFKTLGARQCGTTNIDYSSGLYDEFQKIRTYKTTRLAIDPTGFSVKTGGDPDHREVKIDVPSSWVRGFLQVNSAMTMPALTCELHPMDVHNMCFVLRRRKEKSGPRSMRFVLKPGQPVRILFEPFQIELVCRRSIYTGPDEREVRVWGRRRIHILERLIPIARRFTVHLLGTGLPSFYVADLGDISFTLGLSGWTANDWASAGNLDLLAPRGSVDDLTKRRVFGELQKAQLATPDELAARVGIDRPLLLSALLAYTQAGRAMFDLHRGVYRLRELSREPLPISDESLRFSSPQEAAASALLLETAAGGERTIELVGVTVSGKDSSHSETKTLTGRCRRGAGKSAHKALELRLILDADERIINADCGCDFFVRNRLYKGPCEHMLALRMLHARQAAR